MQEIIEEDKALNEHLQEDNAPFEEKKEGKDLLSEELDQDKKVDENVVSLEKNKEESKEKYWGKLKKEREAKRELLNEIEQLRFEKSEMEQLLHSSLNVGAGHYKTALEFDLEKAEALLEKALDEGSAKDVAKATAAISKVTLALHEAERSAANKLSKPNSYEDSVEENTLKRQYQWLYSNPELNNQTQEFDPELASKVASFVDKVEKKMMATNKSHLIGSAQYYNIIDDYVDNIKFTGSNTHVSQHFGSVRGAKNNTDMVKKEPRKLTLQERKAASVFGQTEQQYLNYLEKYEKESGKTND